MAFTPGSQQRQSHAMSEVSDDERTISEEKASVKSMALAKATNEAQRNFPPRLSVRGKTLPVSARHLLIFFGLLLASTASRLETFPRTETYARIIGQTVNFGACPSEYFGVVGADYPSTGGVVVSTDVTGAVYPGEWDSGHTVAVGGTVTMIPVSRPTPDVGSSFGRRQIELASPTVTVVAPTVTATASPSYGSASPSSPTFGFGYNRCRNEQMGAWVITNLVPWFTAALWAAVSDRVGRRPILLLSTVGIIIADLPIAIFAPMYGSHFAKSGADIPILAFGAIFHSLLGGFLTTLAISLAYLVDTTTSWDRTIVTGFGLAILYLGNFIGAVIPRHSLGLKWTFIVALIIQAIYVLFVVAVLPESLIAEKRQEAKDRRLALKLQETPNRRMAWAKTLGAVVLPFTVFFPTRTGNGTRERPGRKWDSNVFLLSAAFGVGAMMIDGAYFLGPPTIWPSGQDQYSAYWFVPRWRTYSWTWYPLVRGLVLLIITPIVISIMRLKPWEPLAKRFFDNDPEAQVDQESLRVGNTADSEKVDLNVARFATLWTVFLQSTLAYAHPYGSNEKVISIVGAFGALFMPTLISLISVLYTNNGETDVGRLMGGLVFLQAALGQGLGKWIFAVAYDKWYNSFVPGAYYLATALMALLLVVFSFVKLSKPRYLY